MKIIIALLITILYYINSINCEVVSFNNTLTNQCNDQTSPCDLSLSEYWNSTIKSGDDLIIDLTTNNNKNNPYFLILNNFNYQINSLLLKGQFLSRTESSSNLNLNLNGVELNITTQFIISNSNVNLTSSKVNINTFNTTKSMVKFYGQSNIITNLFNLNSGNLTVFDNASLFVNQISNIYSFITHTSSSPIVFNGVSLINGGGIYSSGQVSILTSQGNISIIQNQENNFNISSLVVSGDLLFKGNGRNWRADDNVIYIGHITTLNNNTIITIDTSVFTLTGLINGLSVFDASIVDLEYSSVTIPSGFTIQGDFSSDYDSNTIIIIEGSLPTTVLNCNSSCIDVDSNESSFNFINSTVGSVGTTASWVNVTTSSTFEDVLCVSCNLYIAESQTLFVLDYVQISEWVFVNGTLTLGNEASFEAGNVSIPDGGKLYINDDVKVSSTISASSLEFTNKSIVYSSLNITENGYLTVDSKDITIKGNLTLSSNATLTINNFYLYDNVTEDSDSMMPYLVENKKREDKNYGGSAAYNDPIFSVSGSVLFDSINFVITFKEPTNLYNNISIVLLQLLQNSTSSYQLNLINMNKPNIQFTNVLNIDDLSPKINFVQQDNTLRLEFDHNGQNSNSSKWKVAFIVVSVIAGVLGIALILVLILKRRINKFNGEYQRLINSGNSTKV